MAEPRFHPAECCPEHCNDRDCPYSHYDTWEIGGLHYISREDALASLPPAKCPVCDGAGIIYDCENGCDECRRPCYECQPAQPPAERDTPALQASKQPFTK